MSNSKVDHIALNGRRLRNIRSKLHQLIRSAQDVHRRASVCYRSGLFDGGKMRNLDDLVMHLEDARKEILEYMGR